jgi:hypothetical protein
MRVVSHVTRDLAVRYSSELDPELDTVGHRIVSAPSSALHSAFFSGLGRTPAQLRRRTRRSDG